MRRVWVSYTWLLLLAGGFGALAWLTRHPDAKILTQAENWPLVGPGARKFRELYRPPGPARSRSLELVPRPQLVPAEPALPWSGDGVWAVRGTLVHRSPSSTSTVVEQVADTVFLPVVRRDGDWAQVERANRDRGWVYADGSPPWGEEPALPLPLPGRAPESRLLQLAQEILGLDEPNGALGPYDLYTDSVRPGLVPRLAHLARQVEEVYGHRYQCRPAGSPAEAIILFSRQDDYIAFKAGWGSVRGLEASGIAGYGIVALSEENRAESDVAATFLHELVHLLNRRALGPALPAWLDEGLADDLAQSEIDSSGTLRPGTYTVVRDRYEDRIEIHGAGASLNLVLRAQAEGRLVPMSALLQLPWRHFVDSKERGVHYGQAAFWIRYLLHREEERRGFLAFLAGVSEGEPATPGALLSHLDRSWGELELGFRAWLVTEGMAKGVAP